MRVKAFVGRAAWIFGILMVAGQAGFGQNPTACASLSQRANSNGNANSCPNVNGTAYASNFAGTTYANVPASAKTGTFQLTYAGANAGLLPYAITKVWLTSGGTTIQTVQFGPAGVPVVSGGNTQVNYCFYGMNLPTAGTLSFQLTDPQTGAAWGVCSYDASCNTNCVVVANPGTLPVKLENFSAVAQPDGSVALGWATAQEQNNKGFWIERSGGDSSWASIGFLPTANAGGNSSMETTYQYLDRQAAGMARAAYRLRQEDLDGNLTYSEIAVVNLLNSAGSVAVYAYSDQIKIEFASAAQFRPCHVIVYDTQGRTLKRIFVQSAGVTVVHDLPRHNVYYVALNSGDGQRRVMKAVYVN